MAAGRICIAMKATTNRSLRIKLVGTKSNRDGIGAVIRLVSGDD